MEQLAECMWKFDEILNRTLGVFDAPGEKYPSEIAIFKYFIITIYKEAEISVDEMLNSTQVKIDTQKVQGCIQDNLDMTTLTNASFDVDNCAYCTHRFVVPIGMDIGKLTKYNTKVGKEHLLKMKKWTNIPSKRRGVKPHKQRTKNINEVT